VGGMPVWSPDGTHVLFTGVRDSDGVRDWYVTDLSSDLPLPLHFEQFVARTTLQYPCGWAGDYIYYSSGSTAEGLNLYRVRITPRPWRLSGLPERLTSGPGFQQSVSVAKDGLMLYSNSTWKMTVWAVPFDANRGTVTGEMRQLPSDEMVKIFPAISRDGGAVVYGAFGGMQEHRLEARLRALPNGPERLFAATFAEAPVLYPRLSRDASLLAYSELSQGKNATWLVKPAAESAPPSQVCSGCRVLGFFTNGDLLLLYGGTRLVRQSQPSGQPATLASLAQGKFAGDGALSPDDGWVALQEIRSADSRAAVRLLPLSAGHPAVALADGPAYVASPRWSPDGRVVYYYSDRDGYLCIWAQRVDPKTKALAGEPFAVLHEHRSRYRVDRPRNHATFDVGAGWLVWWRVIVTGNIWKTRVHQDRS